MGRAFQFKGIACAKALEWQIFSDVNKQKGGQYGKKRAEKVVGNEVEEVDKEEVIQSLLHRDNWFGMY